MSERDKQASEAEKREMPVPWRLPAFETSDRTAATTITMTLVANVTTITGTRAGTSRPTRSRAAMNKADAKASRAAGEIPAGPGCATKKAPAKPTNARATRAAPTRSRRRKATAKMRISGAV
jgi:hypothetical protein